MAEHFVLCKKDHSLALLLFFGTFVHNRFTVLIAFLACDMWQVHLMPTFFPALICFFLCIHHYLSLPLISFLPSLTSSSLNIRLFYTKTFPSSSAA